MTNASQWIAENKPSGWVNDYITRCMNVAGGRPESIKKYIGEIYPNIKIFGPPGSREFYEISNYTGPEIGKLLTREPYDGETLSNYKLTNLHLYALSVYRIKSAAYRQYGYDLIAYNNKNYVFKKKNMMDIKNIIN